MGLGGAKPRVDILIRPIPDECIQRPSLVPRWPQAQLNITRPAMLFSPMSRARPLFSCIISSPMVWKPGDHDHRQQQGIGSWTWTGRLPGKSSGAGTWWQGPSSPLPSITGLATVSACFSNPCAKIWAGPARSSPSP